MSEKYEPGSTDSLFDRIAADETGELRHVVMELIDLCKTACQLGVPLDELATCCTLAWYMGQSPEFEKMYDMILSGIPPEQNIDN